MLTAGYVVRPFRRTLRVKLVENSESGLASLCVTCPNRNIGLCGALFESVSHHATAGHSWQQFAVARAGKQIVTRHQASDPILVLCTGWAFRYFQLADGSRQILKFLLPGDILSPAAIFSNSFAFSVKALTEVQVSGFTCSAFRERWTTDTGIQSAVARSLGNEARDAAELLAVLGQRTAEERIAYLFLHLIQRISARTVVRDQRYPVPLRQQHIADAVGLTPVHVSRVLSLFRDRRILTLSDGVLQVADLQQLERIGCLR